VIIALQLNITRAQVLFIPNGQNLTSADSWYIRLVDINGDKNIDAYDGKGKFIDSKLRLGNSNSIQVDIGDINGDKKIDAVVINVKLDNKVSPPVSVSWPVEIWLKKTF
jgi:hypothetical protein